MYIAIGLPVIVWKGSGLADFVLNHQVGIAVDSILDLPLKLQSMTIDNYELYRTNAQAESKKIIHGFYFIEALRRAEKYIVLSTSKINQ